MWPDIPLVKDATMKLEIAKTRLEKTDSELRSKLYNMIATGQAYDPEVNKTLNKLRFMDQVLDVNTRFLTAFENIFALDEPALFTTISRGIFELHLILLEAMSSDEKFVKIQFKIADSYRLFIERGLSLALKSENSEGIKTFRRELERIGQLNKERYRMWKVDTNMIGSYSKHFDFRAIAEKNKLIEDYRLDYGMLSSFLHPTDLYILSCLPIPRTLEPDKQKKAEWNVRNRKTVVKNECIRIAVAFSERNNENVLEVMRKLT
jgi:hypothetical protein